MIKRKGAGAVMGIILISCAGWAAVVAFVIKPNFWVGSALSLAVGTILGLLIVLLLRRWWFKSILRR